MKRKEGQLCPIVDFIYKIMIVCFYIPSYPTSDLIWLFVDQGIC